jgi:transaldolase
MGHNGGMLKKLSEFGQSPWYDNIDRRLIESGELRQLFDRGIVGLTSNPTIFEKAINGSTVYDGKIRALKEKGLGLQAIYDELTADDVRDTADLLSDVYEKTRGVDGYVSIEVLPAYAHDTAKTIEYARAILKKVGRKNIMIKVPGTKESPEAIRVLVREGISINATLLFSVSQYEAVAMAYWAGLEDALRYGMDLSQVASVASVFVSRIDTKVDFLLDAFASREHNLEGRDLFLKMKGKIAIANAKAIYNRFKAVFSKLKFSELESRGARPQRVLWASTGTKNPLYSDCLYVDNLIGPSTVNTMPHQTALAFDDHGQLSMTLEACYDEALKQLDAIRGIGINLERLCDEALDEGVKAFEQSFESLMASLKAKTE